MKTIFQFVLVGAAVGFIYSFVSFFLLTPYARNQFFVYFYMTFQGGLFGFSYSLIELIYKLKEKAHYKIISGVLSGIISATPYVLITYNNTFILNNFSSNYYIESEILRSIAFYFLGSAIIGGVVGMLDRTHSLNKYTGSERSSPDKMDT